MSGNPVAARAVMREQMSEFMKKGAGHFRRSKLQKPGIESDERAPGESCAGCAPHPRVPSNLQTVRQLRATQGFQQSPSLLKERPDVRAQGRARLGFHRAQRRRLRGDLTLGLALHFLIQMSELVRVHSPQQSRPAPGLDLWK
jgi:hypothetical protein